MDDTPIDPNTDTLESWLALPMECTGIPPSTYWHAQGTSASQPQSLVRMAKDFLSIPGMYLSLLM